jgi:hypothetical protein
MSSCMDVKAVIQFMGVSDQSVACHEHLSSPYPNQIKTPKLRSGREPPCIPVVAGAAPSAVRQAHSDRCFRAGGEWAAIGTLS